MILINDVSQILKDDINSRLTGLASSVLREKMISLILSDQFPSVEHCNIYQQERKEEEGEEEEKAEQGEKEGEAEIRNCVG